MKHKFETSEFKEMLDSNFLANIKNSIEDIEAVRTSSLNDFSKLSQIESKYSQIAQELNKKIDNEIDAKKKEKERQLKLEQELKQKKLESQNAFLAILKQFEIRFNEIKTQLCKQIDILNAKIKIIIDLSNQFLLNQTDLLLNSLNSSLKEIDNINEKVNKSFQPGFLETLDEKQMNDIKNDLNANLAKFAKIIEENENRIKLIDEETKKAITDLLQAKKDKEAAEAREIAERQRLKEAKELQEKLQAEQALKEKLEKEAALKKAQEEKQAQLSQVQNLDENNRKGINNFTLEFYEKTRTLFEKYRKESEEALNTRDFKMYKFDLQKAINFPLNSMLEDKDSEENRRNFNEKIKTLIRLLSGQTCTITSTLTVNPTKHPKAIDFCLVYLARKIVEKGEETVGSRPETSFQYCQLIVDILKTVPHFEIILMGQLQERCPYVVPFYKQRLSGQSDEQYYESLGFKIIDGKIEEDVHFFKRMSGVAHLYFTLLIIANNLTNLNGYFCLKRAWQWLVDVLNMSPRPNTTAEMLAIYFKCCGYQMQVTYGRQFYKLVDICMNDYFKMIQSIPSDKQSGAAVGRLQTIFGDFKKNGNRFQEWKNLTKHEPFFCI